MGKKRTDPLALITAPIERAILNFACAMIKARRIDGEPDRTPAGWIERNLLVNGRIGYLHSRTNAEGFYNVTATRQVDRYGMPTQVTARTQATGSSGFVVRTTSPGEDTDGRMTIIRANATATPPYETILRYAEMIAKAEKHINVNLLASMRSQIVGIPDDQKASFDIIIEDALQGIPSAIAESLVQSMQTFDISVPLDSPQVHALSMQLWAEVLKQFGGITPAAYKPERTQNSEVQATVAQSIDNVYMLIDQANADMEAGDVPYRLEYAGMGARYDEGEPINDTMGDIAEPEVKEYER